MTTVVGSNASELEEHHATLKAWAISEGIPLPPIGHNEIVGPSESLSPAANLAFLSTLERLEAEHSCRACWTDDMTKQSPCNDNSLDSLLTNDCLANHSLGPNKGYKPPWYVFHLMHQIAASNWLLRYVAPASLRCSHALTGGHTKCLRS